MLLLVSILMSGCYVVRDFNIDILHPAQISLQPEIKSVVIIDNAFPMRDSLKVKVQNKSVQYTKDVVDTFSTVALRKLYQTLKGRNFFDTVYWHQTALNIPPDGYANKPVAKSTFQLIKQNTQADIAIVLNRYEYSPEISYVSLAENLDWYYMGLKNIGLMDWFVIDLNTSKIIDHYNQVDTLSWDVTTDKLVFPINGLPSLKETAVSLADYQGYYFADHITPWWESKRRYYFSAQGYGRLAEDFIVAKNWVEVEKVWYFQYKNTRQKAIKARMAHNLALAKEMQCDFDAASRWAFDAVSIYKSVSDYYTYDLEQEKNYYKELIKRKLDNDKISSQIGS
jgi:hypothetical protein